MCKVAAPAEGRAEGRTNQVSVCLLRLQPISRRQRQQQQELSGLIDFVSGRRRRRRLVLSEQLTDG